MRFSSLAFVASAVMFIVTMIFAPDRIEGYCFALFTLGASISIQLDEMRKEMKDDN